MGCPYLYFSLYHLTWVVWRRFNGEMVMDMDPGRRRAGINKQRVFPLPVPAITTQSWQCNISREA